MQIEISSVLEDVDILKYVPRTQEAGALGNLLYECCAESKKEFIGCIINGLDDHRLIEELKSRGYTITKDE